MRMFTRSRALLLITILLSSAAGAQQLDIHGPSGSVRFGAQFAMLPNGNVVIADPAWAPASNPGARFGAVYLFSPDGTPINTLTGSTPNDQVGEGGITVLASGDYVISSPDWTGFNDAILAAAPSAGAVTWASATTGVGNGTSAVVSPNNSLVGSHTNDFVGQVYALPNGNYVVASSNWSSNPNIVGSQVSHDGAVTWGNGVGGTSGLVSTSNSLTGSVTNDAIGNYGIKVLPNSNYVVLSGSWNGLRGATTLLHGNALVSAQVSAANSLTGTTPGDSNATGDHVGMFGIVVLSNGNYVVPVPSWNMWTGAATWCDGGIASPTGELSASNSLVGDVPSDYVGVSVTALAGNGNYVVSSNYWNGRQGAATWGNGATGAIGSVAANPSITGSAAEDLVGDVTALSSGNYVVSSENWNGNRGSVTFGNGAIGTHVVVGAGNSLLGATAGDRIGTNVLALTNGNYVVGSPAWGGTRGAVTWCGAVACVASSVSAANSLVGNASGDTVGGNLTALRNGNYVVDSSNANNYTGAVTWAKGTGATVGTLAATPSIVGAAPNDRIGSNGILALANGNYVVMSPGFSTGHGAATWANGSRASQFTLSAANSLVGSVAGDGVGSAEAMAAFADGNYAFVNGTWGTGGAVTLGIGSYASLTGAITSANSVLPNGPNGSGRFIGFSYDAGHHLLAVGRPEENIVSLFTVDELFKDGFQAR